MTRPAHTPLADDGEATAVHLPPGWLWQDMERARRSFARVEIKRLRREAAAARRMAALHTDAARALDREANKLERTI